MSAVEDFSLRPAPEPINRMFGIIASRFRANANRPQVAAAAIGYINQTIADYPGQVFLHAAAISTLLQMDHKFPELLEVAVDLHVSAMEAAALRPQIWDPTQHDIRRSCYLLTRLCESGRLDTANRVLSVLECQFTAPAKIFGRTYADLDRVCIPSFDQRRALYARQRDAGHADARSLRTGLAAAINTPADVEEDVPIGWVQRPWNTTNPRWEEWMNE